MNNPGGPAAEGGRLTWLARARKAPEAPGVFFFSIAAPAAPPQAGNAPASTRTGGLLLALEPLEAGAKA